jgi:outer membrane biosynthesis protein TonB
MRRSSRSLRSLVAAAILIAVVTPASRAAAQAETPPSKGTDADEAEARRIFRRGQAHYNLNEYAQAADDFEGAYRLFPHPTFLYNAAQAHRLAGNDERALYFYRVYLRVEPKSKMRAEVQDRIAALEKAVQRGTASSPPPSSPPPSNARPPSSPAPSTTPPPSPAPSATPPSSPAPSTAPPASPAPSTTPPPSPPPSSTAPAPAPTPSSAAPASAPPPSGSPSATTPPAAAAPTSATPGDSTAAPANAVSAQAPEKTPVYKKWWLWTIVGVVVVGVAIGAGVGATAGGSNSPPAIHF